MCPRSVLLQLSVVMDTSSAGVLKVRGVKFIGPPATARIDSCSGPADQFSIRIEGAEKVGIFRRQTGHEAFERISSHKERTFDGAVIAPETDRIPSRIEASAKIWKNKGHCGLSHIA